MAEEKKLRPEQSQYRPGVEDYMDPIPDTKPIAYPKKGKMTNKNVLITGGDSGIGKAVGLLFAKEGANITFVYLAEHEEAENTRNEILEFGGKCFYIQADLSQEDECKKVIDFTMQNFETLDVIINNAGLHWESDSLENISTDQWIHTFHNNVSSCFWITKYGLKYMKEGASIIITTSVTAYRGSDHLIDYATSKGALVAFMRSLSENLIKKGIRVNAVAPGPVWTPLIASTFSKEDVATFGSDKPMGRAAMPNEIAPSYLFLASQDASFISGQVIHPNGGEIING